MRRTRIRVPTVIDIMPYDDANVHEHIVGRARRTEADLARLAGKAISRRAVETSLRNELDGQG